MANPIRFKEGVAQVNVSGQRLGGSFLKVTDVEITPDADIMKTPYAGERRLSPDLDIKGYDFSFSHHKTDKLWWTLWDTIQSAEENGDELPEIALTLTESYRDNGRTGLTRVLHGNLVMKMDSDKKGGGDYDSVSWSGFAQYMSGA